MFTARSLIRVGISLALFIVFFAYVNGALPLTFVDQLERSAYDARVRLAASRTVDPRIVIVDIDDKTLKEQGQWPLPRDKFAQLVDNLFDKYHIKVVGFDVEFPDADRSQDLALLDQLSNGALKADPAFIAQAAKVRPQLERDKIFAASLANRAVVLGYVFYPASAPQANQRLGQLPSPVLPDVRNRYPLVAFPTSVGYTANLPVLEAAAAGHGFFSNSPDEDGFMRRVTLLQEYGGDVYASLDLSLLQVLQRGAPVSLGFDPGAQDMGHLEHVVVGDFSIPVDNEMAALVPYRGPFRSFPYVSATDVIKGVAPADVLKDAVVYVGTSSPGLEDLRSTPVGQVYPGVEVHANLLSGILDGRVMNAYPQYLRGALLLLLAVIAVLVTWVAMTRSVIADVATVLAITAMVLLGDLALWKYAAVVFPVMAPLVFLLALFVFHSLYGFFIESRGKRHLSKMFSQYIPPELVEEMDERKDTASMESESRELTVMFADVRDFTSISEALQPKDLSQLMNEYLTPMTRVIHTHRGTIDKYMGDAIMSFWGAPLHYPEHARYAVETALEMTETLKELNQAFKAKGWPELRIGVGITTGVMSVGDMGSEFRRAYTVMGDAVNLSSRLEGLTKEYKVQILCSEMTKDAAPEFQYLELDRVRVKGKEKPVGIYEPLMPKDKVDKDLKGLLLRHKQALTAYRNQDWDTAEREFFSLQQSNPGRPVYGMYLDRITYFRSHSPGADWDGVFTFKTK
ncbi:MAG TPA: adenylate/guanylate cyclase domain-containing protein [Gammaproteobacteria bacterium]|nr:adenylate/guanylate cyclase domain-containing protein [Gammaproteobacteria bacterium]